MSAKWEQDCSSKEEGRDPEIIQGFTEPQRIFALFEPQEGMALFTQNTPRDTPRDRDTDRDTDRDGSPHLQLHAIRFVFHSRPPILEMENKTVDR